MAIVTRGATFASKNLVEIADGQARIVMRCVRGLDSGPRVRGRDTVIPGLAGRVVRNRVNDGRVIELEGFVAGVGGTQAELDADFRAAVEELRAIFDPTASPATLVIALEDGGTATITARTLPENPMWGGDEISCYRTLSVELEAVGTDWAIEAAGS
jgi:hypothetical protein